MFSRKKTLALAVGIGALVVWIQYDDLRESAHQEAKHWGAQSARYQLYTREGIIRPDDNVVQLTEPHKLHAQLDALDEMGNEAVKLWLGWESPVFRFPAKKWKMLQHIRVFTLGESTEPLKQVAIDFEAMPMLRDLAIRAPYRPDDLAELRKLFPAQLERLNLYKLYVGASELPIEFTQLKNKQDSTGCWVKWRGGAAQEAEMLLEMLRSQPNLGLEISARTLDQPLPEWEKELDVRVLRLDLDGLNSTIKWQLNRWPTLRELHLEGRDTHLDGIGEALRGCKLQVLNVRNCHVFNARYRNLYMRYAQEIVGEAVKQQRGAWTLVEVLRLLKQNGHQLGALDEVLLDLSKNPDFELTTDLPNPLQICQENIAVNDPLAEPLGILLYAR